MVLSVRATSSAEVMRLDLKDLPGVVSVGWRPSERSRAESADLHGSRADLDRVQRAAGHSPLHLRAAKKA